MIDFLTKHAGLLGLLIFFSFFVVMAVWIFRPGSRHHYQNQAKIPLHEDRDDRP